MKIRYFDRQGRRLSYEELRQLDITTPVMEHVVATVAQRLSGEPEANRAAGLVRPIDDARLV